MAHHDEYRQWPFLNEEEFELACALFDQRYVRTHLGPTRQIFKIRHRRIATTSSSYIEILRLLQLPDEPDELSSMLERLGGSLGQNAEVDMNIDSRDEDDDQVKFANYQNFHILTNFMTGSVTARPRCSSWIHCVCSTTLCDL